MADRFSILSTGSLAINESIVSANDHPAATVDVIPFIKIVWNEEEDTREKIRAYARETQTVIFTSTNAVSAVINVLRYPPDWKIFCVGSETKKRVTSFFGDAAVADHARNAEELSEKIVRRKEIKAAVFFCGDQRRDTLPDQLNAAGISLKELSVYRTMLTPVRLTKGYDAILFFSPTAVNSFFSLNTPPSKTILFALGETTANAVRNLSDNEVLLSPKPSKTALLQTAIDYGSTHTIP